jgi:hypothetical protein
VKNYTADVVAANASFRCLTAFPARTKKRYGLFQTLSGHDDRIDTDNMTGGTFLDWSWNL